MSTPMRVQSTLFTEAPNALVPGIPTRNFALILGVRVRKLLKAAAVPLVRFSNPAQKQPYSCRLCMGGWLLAGAPELRTTTTIPTWRLLEARQQTIFEILLKYSE